MPAKKLTLRLDEEVVERAKEYSKRHDTSISRIVETYLSSLTDRQYNIMPRVRRLTGVLHAEREKNAGRSKA